MNRMILRLLNGPGLVLFCAIGVAVQTSFFQSWPLVFLQPDIVLLMVLWCALRRGFTEGGMITLLIADIAEIHTAAPQGFFMITYMSLYLLIRGASKIFVIPNLASFMLLTLFASVYWKLAGLGILYLLGASANQWRHTLLLLFPGAVIESAIAYWVFKWLDRWDWITFKSGRAEQVSEDEMLLESEGI